MLRYSTRTRAMSLWTKSIAALTLPLLLAGCARFESKPISATHSLEHWEGRNLSGEGLKRFLESNLGHEISGWPLPFWDFETLSLAALYYHPSLDVARAEWGVAQAGIVTAGARPNPTISVVPQYTVNSPSDVSPWLTTINFDIPIETAGKRGYRRARAQQLSEAARLNLATAAWRVRSHLREVLLEHIVLQQRAERLRRQEETLRQLSQLYDERVKTGTLTATEALPTRLLLQKNLLELTVAKQSAADNRVRLAEAIGVPLTALAGINLSPDLAFIGPGFDPEQGPRFRREALERRPDILSALAEYAAAQSTLQLEIAKQYPDVHLGPGYEYDQGENKWALGLSVELPVRNRNQGPIAEAQAKREEAAARFTALQAQVIAEIDRALTAHQASQEQLASVDSLLRTQQRYADSVQALFTAGSADRAELVTAQLELATAQLTRLDALFKVQQALGQVEDALQDSIHRIPRSAFELGRTDPGDSKP